MFSERPLGGRGWKAEAFLTFVTTGVTKPSASEFGGVRMPPSIPNVTAASTTSTTAAPIVQPTSRRVLPRIWAATASLRARNLTSE